VSTKATSEIAPLTARVLAAWVAILAIEDLLVATALRRHFALGLEVGLAVGLTAPLSLAALLLAAPVGALLLVLGREGATVTLALSGALAAGFLGVGVTGGRHFASLPVRVAFVAAVAAVGAAGAALAWPRLVRVAERARPAALLLAIGVALAVLVAMDARVLPRLYPAFHEGLIALGLVIGALGAFAVPDVRRLRRTLFVLATLAALLSPWAAARLHPWDNVRITLVEHAPLGGRAVRLASWLSPPPVDDVPEGPGRTFTEIARSLDWTGRDVVLLTVDALRADHVSAYGYGRPTTPNLDGLAAEGARFDAAYCPTPHTSYSVTSMLTGKYMRPLLALGLGADSETWATYLRRYGYRTGAFYPPAVFFIDEQRFESFRDSGLGFEYRKVEFADPDLRLAQVRAWLGAPEVQGHPIFLWLHFFEPHEPYVPHPGHIFGDPARPTDVDAYDAEVARADEGIGMIVRAVREVRPHAVFLVTADHGEEFGDHGGRYHGTTVYEEQVRVPLVVVGPGVRPRVLGAPVQTIDLLPTVLSALGIPRPPRLRGRDLGPVLAGGAEDAGFAFAETDDQTLLAEGPLRLVCLRRAAACSLYDRSVDPGETTDRARERPADLQRLQGLLAATARDHGRFETGGDALPDALRRALQGDLDADEDAAALLDDADVAIRRKAAEALFELASPRVAAQLVRAETRDEDTEVQRFARLARVRSGDEPAEAALALLEGADPSWRRRAALAMGERGDGRAVPELVAWWAAEAPPHGGLAFPRARQLLSVFAKLKARPAAPVIATSLGDVRLRAHVADALGAIGDRSVRPQLLEALSHERYVGARLSEARALLALGAGAELGPPLAHAAGLPEPMPEAIGLAAAAGALGRAGIAKEPPAPVLEAELEAGEGELRLWVLLAEGAPAAAEVELEVDGRPLPRATRAGDARFVDLPGGPRTRTVRAASSAGLRAAWLVRRLGPDFPDAGLDGAGPLH
jgi:arylsulfatase A-like enzyme